MDIEFKIEQEENRHYEVLRELREILNMYHKDAVDNKRHVDKLIDGAVKGGVDPKKIIVFDEVRRDLQPYEKRGSQRDHYLYHRRKPFQRTDRVHHQKEHHRVP